MILPALPHSILHLRPGWFALEILIRMAAERLAFVTGTMDGEDLVHKMTLCSLSLASGMESLITCSGTR